MSESKRSFWSTIPGFVTGLAGLLTAVVGLVTVLIQLDIIGGDDSDRPVGTTGTTVVGGTQGGGGGVTPTTELGRLTVSPASLKLQPTERDKSITVKNPTSSATVTVLAPEFTGTDKAVFKADAGCTNVRLDPGRSCTLKVLFAPSGPLKTYSATLVIKGDGRTPATEVPIEASTLL